MRTLDKILCSASLLVLLLFLPGGLDAQTKSDISPGGKSAPGKPDLSPSSLYARNKTSVVTILTFSANKAPLTQGSGFIVAPNRVVTNYHVIEGSSEASVVFDDGTIVSTDSVAAVSGPMDLVILAVKTGNKPPLQFGNELDTKIGETVYAIGSPQGLSASLSSGLLSAFREETGQFLLQITASISPGSSGGPLFNSKGRVIGITTSKLKDGSFGFAVGADEIQHLLRVPVPADTKLGDLVGAAELAGAAGRAASAEAPSANLAPVEALFKQQKYVEAEAAFRRLPAGVQHSFDAQLYLCKIQIENETNRNTAACDAAIALKPNDGAPYFVKGLAELASGNLAQAEVSAAKAGRLSPDVPTKNLLGLVYYMEEKYTLVPDQVSEDQGYVLPLILLEGAAIHAGDREKYLRLEAKLKSIKGSNGPWQTYWEGLAAANGQKLSEAEKAFRKCNRDPDFKDAICAIDLADTELKEGLADEAKKDIDQALHQYLETSSTLHEAIFIYLAMGDKGSARAFHQKLESKPSGLNDVTDCLYYYGMDQPQLAYDRCVSALHGNENNYEAWINIGYAALDLGRYQVAADDFTKAGELYEKDTALHSDAQTLDLLWGTLLANYVNGSKENAKKIDRLIQGLYPKFSTVSGLEKLPLVWSTQTKVLISKAIQNLR